MENSDHKDVAISRLCQEFEQTLSGFRAGIQANSETLEEGIGKLADAKQSFDLQIADAIGLPTNSEFWKKNVFYRELKKAAPERWQEVQKLRTKADSLKKELARRLAQRRSVERLAHVCLDFREQLRQTRDPARTATVEDRLSQLEKAKQSFDLQVAAAIERPTTSDYRKDAVFYLELRNRAPARWEEVRELRTDADSLKKELAKQLAQSRSVEHLVQVCSDFHEQLRRLRDATQARTLEEHLRQLERARESFDRQVANAIGFPTASDYWQHLVFYTGLRERTPERWNQVRNLRTEAESLQKKLERQLAQGRLAQVCSNFHEQLRHIRDATQAATSEQHLGQLKHAKQNFDLKVAAAIGHPTAEDYWKKMVFYRDLRRRAPGQWKKVRDLTIEAESLQKEVERQLALGRLVPVCSDFRERLAHVRDRIQASAEPSEEDFSKLQNAKQSFELKVATAIGFPTGSDYWKNAISYAELRKRAPERWEEVRDLRTEAESLQKELAKQFAQRRSGEHLVQLCSDFHERLRRIRDATQAGTSEQHLGQLKDAKENFELQIASAISYPTASDLWKKIVFYTELRKRAPQQWEEVQKLRTEANSLKRELEKQLVRRRLAQGCSDFREQLRRTPDPTQGGTIEERLNQLKNAKQSFELKIAAAISYSTASDYWKHNVFYRELRRRAPERWEEVRDLRTEAQSLQNSLQKNVEFICAKFGHELISIRIQLQSSAESLETPQTELGIAIENFTIALGSAIDQEITEAVWQDISQFRASLLKGIPEWVEKISGLREQALTTERELAKVESQLLATSLLPQASQPLRDRARTDSRARTEKTFFVEARQLRPLSGEPNYRVLPADLWMEIAQAAAATVRVDASHEVLFLPPVDRPKLRIITNGSLALPSGKLMAVEVEKALIVRGSVKLEACAAGFVYAGACELGKLAVNGRGYVNIEHLKALEDYAKAQVPQIDVAAGFMLCRKIEWPYPTIDCLQLTYVEWPTAPAHPFLRDRESRTSLSAYEERKQRMMKDIHAGAKVSVPRVVARMAPLRQSSAAIRSQRRAP
jgi:predicted transcriptional regulator